MRNATRAVDEFTRPSDISAYTIGDVIAATVSLTSTTPLRGLALALAPGEPFRLAGWSLATNKTDFLATVRVHLYSVPDTAAAPNSGTALVGDNVPMVQTYNNLAVRLGQFDLPALALQHAAGDNLVFASRFEDLDIVLSPASNTGGYAEAVKVYYRYEIVGGSSITPASGQKFYTRASALWL